MPYGTALDDFEPYYSLEFRLLRAGLKPMYLSARDAPEMDDDGCCTHFPAGQNWESHGVSQLVRPLIAVRPRTNRSHQQGRGAVSQSRQVVIDRDEKGSGSMAESERRRELPTWLMVRTLLIRFAIPQRWCKGPAGAGLRHSVEFHDGDPESSRSSCSQPASLRFRHAATRATSWRCSGTATLGTTTANRHPSPPS